MDIPGLSPVFRRFGSIVRYSNIGKTAEVPIEGGDGKILSGGEGGDNAIDKVELGFSVTLERIQVNRLLLDLNTRTRNQRVQC